MSNKKISDGSAVLLYANHNKIVFVNSTSIYLLQSRSHLYCTIKSPPDNEQALNMTKNDRKTAPISISAVKTIDPLIKLFYTVDSSETKLKTCHKHQTTTES